jgi:hypothetical protein
MNAHLQLFCGIPFWIDKACEDLKNASNVVVASPMYDDGQLHTALLATLDKRSSVTLFVDKEAVEKKTCKGMLSKLKELKVAGGHVFICTGEDGKNLFGPNAQPGIFHAKVVVVDGGKVVWYGGSNATKSARKNVEFMTRLRGPATSQFVTALAGQTARGTRF